MAVVVLAVTATHGHAAPPLDVYERLPGAGKPVELVKLAGEDHWLSRGETRLAMLKAAVAFVEKHNPTPRNSRRFHSAGKRIGASPGCHGSSRTIARSNSGDASRSASHA